MIDKGRKKLPLLPSQFGKLNKIEIVKEKLNSARVLQQPLSSKYSLQKKQSPSKIMDNSTQEI